MAREAHRIGLRLALEEVVHGGLEVGELGAGEVDVSARGKPRLQVLRDLLAQHLVLLLKLLDAILRASSVQNCYQNCYAYYLRVF